MGDGKRWKTGIPLILPCLLFIFAFMVYPLVNCVYLSFHEHSPLRSPEVSFIGLENYQWAARSDIVVHSFYITALFTATSTALELLVGLSIAITLARLTQRAHSKIRRAFNRVSRSIFIVPWAVPTVVAAVSWRMLFHAQFGPINAITETILGVRGAWLTEYPLLSIIIADTWITTPFIIFILFAAIMSIPPDQSEAAKIDGASGWQEFRYVTLPSILPVMAVATAFRAMDAFTKIFDVVYVMTGGGPAMRTQVFPLLIWKTAFSHFHFGKASVLAVIGIAISVVAGAILIFRRRG